MGGVPGRVDVPADVLKRSPYLPYTAPPLFELSCVNCFGILDQQSDAGISALAKTYNRLVLDVMAGIPIICSNYC
jgi:hypothetical protein